MQNPEQTLSSQSLTEGNQTPRKIIVGEEQANTKILLKIFVVYPKIHLYGMDSTYTYLMMDMMVCNLEQERVKAGGRLPIYRVLQIGIKLLLILESKFYSHKSIVDLHSYGIIHRDIKPENIMIANVETDQIKLVDFGLAKRIVVDDKHIKYKENKGLVGTARYASANCLKGIRLYLTILGIQSSRRDDMESLFYSLVYLALGTLPWMKQSYKDKTDKHGKIMTIKQNLGPSSFKKWQKLPESLFKYFALIRQLDFYDRPKYEEYLQLFQTSMMSLTSKNANVLDISQLDSKSQTVHSHKLRKRGLSNSPLNIKPATSNRSEPLIISTLSPLIHPKQFQESIQFMSSNYVESPHSQSDAYSDLIEFPDEGKVEIQALHKMMISEKGLKKPLIRERLKY